MEIKLFTWPIFEETRIKRKEKMQWKLGYANFFRLDLKINKKWNWRKRKKLQRIKQR